MSEPTRAERLALHLTNGRPFNRLVARLVNTVGNRTAVRREVIRHGLRWELDLTEFVQWYTFWGWTDPSHDALIGCAIAGAQIVDVGANIGMTALRLAAAAGPAGRVLAIEPDPSTADHLRHHAVLNQRETVEVLEVALGRAPGTAALGQPSPTNRGMGRLTAAAGTAVRLSTLDLEVERRGLRVDLLKIDTEGSEMEVLLGGAATIRRDRPVLFIEVDDANLGAQGSSAAEVLGLLQAWNYAVETVDGEGLAAAGPHFGRHTDVICRPLAGRNRPER